LVDVYETASLAQAQKCLLEALANNQLTRLPEGPNDLGEVSFIHPEGVPPAVFWVTGNLCVSVCSLGRTRLPVLDWAYRLQARMLDRPKVRRLDLALTPSKARLSVEEEVAVGVSLPRPLGEDGYYKLLAAGGELLFKGEEIFVRAQQKGELVVEAFAVEPGRP